MSDKPHYRRTADGQTVQVRDGLVNMTTGMGTVKDKTTGTRYVETFMTAGQLWSAYDASSLVRNVIDLPSEDSVREWRNWQAESDDISKIEAEEKRLGIKAKTYDACQIARLEGESAILIGAETMDPMEELDPTKIGVSGIKYLLVLGKDDFQPQDIDTDVNSPTFGQPAYYRVGDTDFHPSRLSVFYGIAPRKGIRVANGDGRGKSVLIGLLESIKRVDAVAGNVLSLVYEAKIDIFGIPDLMENMKKRGEQWTEEILRRVNLAAMSKSTTGAMLKDANETYEQKNASFGSLPDIMEKFMQLCSAESGIPMTLLFRMSPGGLNATGESDTRAYYDRVSVHQELRIDPSLHNLNECLIHSALGTRPPELFYEWAPLWQPTAKEKADTGKIIADTHKTMYEMDSLPIEVLAKSLVNALTESGSAPGLEGYVTEYFGPEGIRDMGEDGDEEEEDDDVRSAEVRADDASPRSLYVHRKVLNASDIVKWAKAQGYKNTLSPDDMHVTLAYSKTPVDWMACGQSWQERVTIPAGGPRLPEMFGEASVILFKSEEVEWRHQEIKEAGADWKHPEYQPHITVSWDPGAPDPATVEPYRGPIVLGPEIFAEVDEDWKEKL